MKEALTSLLEQALQSLVAAGTLSDGEVVSPKIEHPKDPSHGDFATNLAMVLAKRAGMPPREFAQRLIDALPDNSLIEGTEIAGPGFINFRLSQASNTGVIREILTQGAEYGYQRHTRRGKVQVEFVSANPTGPLHVGHGRGAAIGDSLSRLLTATGWDVHREFYYNDAGQQISNLALSVQARAKGLTPENANWPDDGYRGEYIADLADAFLKKEAVAAADREVAANGDSDDLDNIRAFAVAWLRREQDADLKAFGVQFDEYFLESSLYDGGEVDRVVEELTINGHTYEQDGALWLRSTEFGDDKDRVMRKREGGYTYFVPDVAYHRNKWRRGYQRVINEQGADHHSTITRVRAGLQGLDAGIPDGWPEYVLHQMVTVMRDGAEVKLSKRAGSYVTLSDLIDWVGRDATRFFLTARAATSQLTFDIDLARSQSNENPVYYIQYAHARVCSVERKARQQDPDWTPTDGLESLDTLIEPEALALALTLSRFPEVVSTAAERLEPHDIANYLRGVAGEFHSFYNAHKMLDAEPPVARARLALADATRQVIANGLALLGVSAPESM
ncbi:arginyl-tRNA synthetase [Luminiphilus syltensis NOR5-1B]|uniref:Arginine--tRNA ligase n=1 Tax=Luminiphilus syltensis NOR5-1B TaxID=565045 RepID=B8KUS9_9GAMM|nr:arginine--tRNA ligase [Luminiphilus syltensis]EED35801.1 arginyl-tRNA synthetase [Luminiphilus syltensis NOR5-1B]